MIKNFKYWFKCAGIRAIKTFAQSFVGAIGGMTLTMGDVNWVSVLSSAAFAAIMSIMTSAAGLPEVKAKEQSDAITQKGE